MQKYHDSLNYLNSDYFRKQGATGSQHIEDGLDKLVPSITTKRAHSNAKKKEKSKWLLEVCILRVRAMLPL